VPVGTEVALSTGDSVYQDRRVVHTVRVGGEQPRQQQGGGDVAADQPGITLSNAEGTPTP
jgi:hypothetical protein